jgi:hypothetical protein
VLVLVLVLRVLLIITATTIFEAVISRPIDATAIYSGGRRKDSASYNCRKGFYILLVLNLTALPIS